MTAKFKVPARVGAGVALALESVSDNRHVMDCRLYFLNAGCGGSKPPAAFSFKFVGVSRIFFRLSSIVLLSA